MEMEVNGLPSRFEFLSGGGELGELIRNRDWSNTSLGPIESWPQSLRTCIRIMLISRQPIWIGWGRELVKFYNDPYRSIVGGKHPWALGTPAAIVWKDIWHDIEPMLKKVMEDNEGTYVESQLLIMERNGYQEETYYTFSYTPIPGDDGKTAGMFCANTDDTGKIISERQLRTLTSLGNRLLDCDNADEVITRTIKALSENSWDFPFSIYRKIVNDTAILSCSTNLGESSVFIPQEIDINDDTPLAKAIKEVVSTGKQVLLDELTANVGTYPSGAWQVPPEKALILPVSRAATDKVIGILVLGINPHRLLDEKFNGFVQLIADQVTTAFTDVYAAEEERKRAEALAEIDKAKTVFFSNISHEFRTPLTLMLGSLEDLLNNPAHKLGALNRESIETTHRNALRLLRLVNNLLDFSRIEAGRVKAHFQRADISNYTEDLASTFRSLVEKAGLEYIVNCQVIDLPVYIDKDMWEKIVLNLLSNAFKFTLEGSITVSLVAAVDEVQLTIEDTGVGIPEEELPKMFERFHRIENTPGRTFEGTGIGLSLVSELVKLHKGTIAVTSEIGKGSVFTISIPAGKAHLPAEQVTERALSDDDEFSSAFIEEAQSFLIRSNDEQKQQRDSSQRSHTLLVVDDNADMRSYIKKLLEEEYNIITAANGLEALGIIQGSGIDLVISDIMMPQMDGIQLVKEIKQNPRTYNLPVILVSARAGEEAKIEGYDTGADDYLIKPFAAKELQARIRSQIKIKQTRDNALKNLYKIFDEVPFAVAALVGDDLHIDFINKFNLDIWHLKKEDVIGKPLFEVFPGNRDQVAAIHNEVMRTQKRFMTSEVSLDLSVTGRFETRYFDVIIDPMVNEHGQMIGQLAASMDITEQVVARKKVEASESLFRNILEQAPDPILILKGADMVLTVANEPLFRVWNVDRSAIGKPFLEILPEMKGQGFFEMLQDVYFNNKIIKGEESPAIFYETDATQRTVYFNFTYQPYRELDGTVTGVLVMATNVTQQVLARRKIEESEERFRTLTTTIPQIVWTTDSAGDLDYISAQWEAYTGQSVEDALTAYSLMVHPEDLPALAAKWESSLKTKRKWRQDYRLMDSRTGEYRWFTASVQPLQNKEGALIKWIGAASDIHEQKQFAEQLEKLVDERTKELARSNHDLQQFAHVASHDLKEPVRKVKTFITRLEDEYSSHLPEKGVSFIGKVQNAANRMIAMIDGVLNYSKVNAGQSDIEPVDLNEIINHIEADLEIPVHQKNALIIKGELPVIQGAQILIYQLFYNLINNSLKFSRPAVHPVIEITSGKTEENGIEYAVIKVSDNGIGFDQVMAGVIFNTFTRLHSKDRYEGTGLGLALCQKIVERHHGKIFANSEKERGAVFTVQLPLALHKHL
jgi:PAS domain S-box-containing protein